MNASVNAASLGESGTLLPPGPAQKNKTFVTDLYWSIRSTDADQSVQIRAHYFLRFSTVADRGMGRGTITVTKVEFNEGTSRNPRWKLANLHSEIFEALEKEIAADERVIPEDEQ